MEASAHVIDVTADTFEREVLARSKQVPVLIDFWAAWCGPCKTLGPILEKLAAEMDGRFVLAKVDVDAEQELGSAFRVQSIPTVLLVVDGRPADGFMGAQPEAQIRAFLEPHLPAQAPAGEASPWAALEHSGDLAGAVSAVREHLRATPDDGTARLQLVRLLLDLGRDDEARKVVPKLTDDDWKTDEGKALRARMDFAEHRSDTDVLAGKVQADPDDLDARLEHGRALVAAGRHEEGLEQLVTIAKRDLGHSDGAARKAMIEVFEMLGTEDALTLEYQRQLSHLLCS